MTAAPRLAPEAEDILNRVAALGLPQKALADAIGIDQNKITKVKTGERQFKAGEVLTAREWLAQHEGTPSQAKQAVVQTTTQTDGDAVEIIALDLSLSMGPGTLIEEFAEAEPVIMGLSLIQSITRTPSDRLRLVKGVGDSMEPTLRTGDRVMIDINERSLSRINGLYWIDYHGAHGIKRLRMAGKDRVLVISDNPTVENFEVDARELRIEGRVIWFAREV